MVKYLEMTEVEKKDIVDSALAEGTILGKGRNRTCLSVPNHPKLCIKIVHFFDGAKKGSRSWKNYHNRFKKVISTNHREYSYISYLKKRLPQHLRRLFPEPCECYLHPDHGWILIEEKFTSIDGSPAHNIEHALSRATNNIEKNALIENFKSIITELAHHGVFFMDQVNLMVIKNTTGDINFKISDLEPNGRALGINFEYLLPCFEIKRRVLRRLDKNLRSFSE